MKLLFLLLFTQSAHAVPKIVIADIWKNQSLTKTWTPPLSGGPLVGEATTQTLSNKTFTSLAMTGDLNSGGNKINHVSELNNTTSGNVLIFSFTASALTVDITNNWLIFSGHGLSPNSPIIFTGVDLPAPLVQGTTYYADVFFGNGPDKIRILATPSGAIIDLTTTGSGLVNVNQTVTTNNPIAFTSNIDASTKTVSALGIVTDSMVPLAGGAQAINLANRNLQSPTGAAMLQWGIDGQFNVNFNRITNVLGAQAGVDATNRNDLDNKFINDITFLRVDGSLPMTADLKMNSNSLKKLAGMDNINIQTFQGQFSFTASALTVDITNNWLIFSGHGLSPNSPIIFTGVDLPAPLVQGTTYYADVFFGNGPDKIRILATPSGAIIDLTTTGSGLVNVNDPIITNSPILVSSDLNFNSTQRITNLPDPVTAQQAATKNYVDADGWKKFTLSHTAFQAASLTNNIELFVLPAKSIVSGVVVSHTIPFSGGTISAYTISVGIAGNLTKYSSVFNVFQASGGTVNQLSSPYWIESTTTSTSVRVEATSVGANLDQSIAGSVDIYVRYTTLP